MSCPLGREQLRPAEGEVPLGLCGPSELQHSLPRARLVLAGRPDLDLKLPAAPPAPSSSAAAGVAELLRAKLRHLSRGAGAELLRPRVGRADLAELVVSFLPETRPLTATATGGWMHCDTGSANLDLFFQAVPQPRPETNHQLHGLLGRAWAESPETCLRQIFLLGASREGKQDRYSFYDALLWLWERQPATVLGNLHLVPETNYWKGLLELLARVCEGPRRSLERDQALHDAFTGRSRKLTARGCEKYPGEGWKPGSRIELAREALKRYDEDPLYRAFFERTGQLFAEQLREDMAAMRAGGRVTLCAKWCPSLYHSFDRRTLVCEAIARWLFPPSLPEFAGTSERAYAYRARDKLRLALSELKEHMKCPERLMCHGRWSEIAYKAVPAACMKIHAKQFTDHDPRRFLRHIRDLKTGKATAHTGALQPHEILKHAQTALAEHDAVGEVIAQAQWEALVSEVKAAGMLDGCIAVCDVSASMMCQAAPNVTCMDVAVALSLLLAEVSGGACARRLITFHQEPELVELPTTRHLHLLDRFARELRWGGSTDFFKVFKLLLPMDPPPKRVFVFSDMQFNAAGGHATVLQKARNLYEAAGLAMPELVFWNLRSHCGAPAVADDAGVALVSGFSSAMMRLLLQGGAPEPPAGIVPMPSEDLSTDVEAPGESEAPGGSEADDDDDTLDDDEDFEGDEGEEGEGAQEEKSRAGPGAAANVEQRADEDSRTSTLQGGVGEGGARDEGCAARRTTPDEEPRADAQLGPLKVLAAALDKPLLRRPRVVHCFDEALQLLQGPQQPVAQRWTAAPPEPAAAPLPSSPGLAHEGASGRWTTQSLHLGDLPCKEAVAAFLGRSVQELREQLRQALRAELKPCKRGLHVWLDVRTHLLPPPLLERGEVTVTAKARVGPARLQAALEASPALAFAAIADAVARAETEPAGRSAGAGRGRAA